MAKAAAVLFDIGGVLLTNGWDRTARMRVFDHFSLDPSAYDQRHEPANDLWEKGLISGEEFLSRTVFFEPRPFTPAEFLEQMKAQSRELPPGHGAMDALRQLRATGRVKLAAVSNEARELTSHRIERFHLDRCFEAFFVSCYLGLRKPDPRIFMVALDVLQLRPEETVFVDDRPENCDAAESVGIHSIRFRDQAQFTGELRPLADL